jgi:hypothetical protein
MAPRLLSIFLAVAALTAGAAAHEGHEEEESAASDSSSTSVEVVGGECDAATSEEVIATIDNSTYFDTCAEAEEGVTFNVSTLFDVLNFTSADFILFCNSSTCLEPLHEMLHSIPTDCLINYEGSDRNLSAEVTAVHDACHEALEGTEEASSSNGSASASTDNAAPSRHALEPTVLAIAVAAASVVVSVLV